MAPVSPDSIAALLRTGGVAVVPAEGVYGLAADAARPDSIARIRALKGREGLKPFLLLIGTVADAKGLAIVTPPWLPRLAAAPLALTLLLPARGHVPPDLVGPEGEVALRFPADSLGQQMVAALGRPIVSTSANLSGGATPAAPEAIPASIRLRADLVVEAGPLAGVPSTIARWSDGRLHIVREGAVDRDQLQALTGEVAG